jgi:hypothetical protein
MFIPFKVKLIKPEFVTVSGSGLNKQFVIHSGDKIGASGYYPTDKEFNNIYTVVAINYSFLLYFENMEPFWWPMDFTLGVK